MLYTLLTLTLVIFAGLIILLVIIGALSQLCSRARSLHRQDDDNPWQETSPLQTAYKSASSIRRSNSSKVESSSPRGATHPPYLRTLSAPLGKAASPKHMPAHLNSSQSSGSSLYEKARKNWMSNMDVVQPLGASQPEPGSSSLSDVTLPTPTHQPEADTATPVSPPTTEESPLMDAPSPLTPPPRPWWAYPLTFSLFFLLILSVLMSLHCVDASCSENASPWCPDLVRLPLLCQILAARSSINISTTQQLLLVGALGAFLVLVGVISSLANRGPRVKVAVAPPVSPSLPPVSPPPLPLLPDFASLVQSELENAGLQVFRADPRGVQIPESVNLDQLDKAQCLLLALPRNEFAREACLMELRLAFERKIPVFCVKEPGWMPVGPSDFAQLVAGLPSERVVEWDSAEGLVQLLQPSQQHAAQWDVFLSHPCKHRVDATLFRPASPVDPSHPHISFRVSTVRDALAVLVAHVAEMDSIVPLSRLVIAQGARGILSRDEAASLLAILRAKSLVRESSEESSVFEPS